MRRTALGRGEQRAGEVGGGVNWSAVGRGSAELAPDGYELVVVARYLSRGLADALSGSLRAGGYLVYEQHFVSEQEVDGPRSRSFRLQPNELLEMFGSLRVLYYREDLMADADGRTMALAQLVACKGSPGF